MTEGQQAQSAGLSDMYCMFAGSIDQGAVQRFHNLIAVAGDMRVKHIHILFQCSGGLIGDGISLFNLFRACPIDLTLYNAGFVGSIGVIVFLGAKHRKTSKYATFMVHRAAVNQFGPSERMTAAANQMKMDDDRLEAILKLNTKIPADKWELHKFADVWISASDAVAYGIAADGEFAPTLGTRLFNVWPPQQ